MHTYVVKYKIKQPVKKTGKLFIEAYTVKQAKQHATQQLRGKKSTIKEPEKL